MRTNAGRHILACAALGALLAGAGCAKRGGGAAAAPDGERRFPLTGEVL